jgi:hypothetical protein
VFIVATIETLDLSSIFVKVVVTVVVHSSIPIGGLSIFLLFSAIFCIMTLRMTHEAFYLADILLGWLISMVLFVRVLITTLVVVVSYISPIVAFITSIVVVTMAVVIICFMLVKFRTSTVLMDCTHLL